MSAVISECGKYRYVLRRSLGSILRWYRPALFIMLNPSIADAESDDPTIRRCMAFAKREGCTHLNVVNLFAYRSPDPWQLRLADDPVGPKNDQFIAHEIESHRNQVIICAWGADRIAIDRAKVLLEHAISAGAQLTCLGKTKAGAPRHPLYVNSNQPIEVYP